jgi:hypothetical protein
MATFKDFYKQLKTFLKELVVVFPEDDDELLIIITSINLAMIDDDSHEIVTKFYLNLLPLESLIFNRDNSIFGQIKWEKSSYEYSLFDKLKINWNTFTENNKMVIWDYITVLYRLSKYLIR